MEYMCQWLKYTALHSIRPSTVYGPPQYQALMASTAVAVTTSPGESGLFCSLLAPVFDMVASLTGHAIDICAPSEILVLTAMLRALNAAVEAYLGTNICFAALVLDITDENAAQRTQEALKVLGISQVLGTQKAARSMVRAHPPNVYNGTDMDLRTVLAIDYSSYWFNIGLYTIEETDLVDPVLGFTDGLRIGEKRQLEAFYIALRDLAEERPFDVESPDTLLLYGDDAHNPEILGIIGSVFGSQVIHDAYVTTSAHDGMDYVAKGAYEHMDTVDFEMRVSAGFGCRWRSDLYSEGRTEL
jgi:hypothetical protein